MGDVGCRLFTEDRPGWIRLITGSWMGDQAGKSGWRSLYQSRFPLPRSLYMGWTSVGRSQSDCDTQDTPVFSLIMNRLMPQERVSGHLLPYMIHIYSTLCNSEGYPVKIIIIEISLMRCTAVQPILLTGRHTSQHETFTKFWYNQNWISICSNERKDVLQDSLANSYPPVYMH